MDLSPSRPAAPTRVMKHLVSLCNKADAESAGHPEFFLVEIDWKDRRIRPIALDTDLLPPCSGITGLAGTGERILALTQSSPSCLVEMSADYRVLGVRELAGAKDCHSLCVTEAGIHIASTGNNSILRVNPGGEVETIWKGGDGDGDTIHLNAVIFAGGDMFVTAFGPRQGRYWLDEKQSGYLKNITTDKIVSSGLRHPHSPVLGYGKIYLCESIPMTVRDTSGGRMELGGGFIRGLCIAEGWLAVGSSKTRVRSRSTGEILKERRADESKFGECAVSLFRIEMGRLDRCTLKDRIVLNAFNDEIYDIISIS